MNFPDDFSRITKQDLSTVFQQAKNFSPESLIGKRFDGISLGLPKIIENLTWIKFGKVFSKSNNCIWGWNVKMKQNALDAPWQMKPETDWGYFNVYPGRVPKTNDPGIVLDYRHPKNSLINPARRTYDVIKEVQPGLLLGRMWLSTPLTYIPTPSYFALSDAG